LSITPKNAVVYNNLGRAFRLKGSRTEAIEAYRQAILLKPDYAEPRQDLAGLLWLHG